MFQFPGRQYFFEMDGVHIKLKVSGLRAFHSLVNNRKSVARQYPSCTNTLKELRRCCSSICGYNTYEIQTIFCTVQPLLKTIVAPFLPTRLTSSGSPRMEWATIRKKKTGEHFATWIQSRPLRSTIITIYVYISLSLPLSGKQYR